MRRTILALVAMLTLAFAAFAADISGKWASDAAGRGGPQTYTFKVDGSALTGSVAGGRGGDVAITDGKVDGDKISFSISRAGRDGSPMKVNYTGVVKGDSIDLSFDFGRGPQTITLKKQ